MTKARKSKESKNYIKNPNDENIHDIRVAIRRLETAHKILPKNVREREKITNYIKQVKILFKLNAKFSFWLEWPDLRCSKNFRISAVLLG